MSPETFQEEQRELPIYLLLSATLIAMLVYASAAAGYIESHSKLAVYTQPAKETTISSMPDKGVVKLAGVIEDINNNHRFTLSDTTGEVEVQTAEAMPLGRGDRVEVVGYVVDGWMRHEIRNANVQFLIYDVPAEAELTENYPKSALVFNGFQGRQF